MHCSSEVREQVKQLIFEAAKAPLLCDFHSSLAKIKALDVKAFDYISGIPGELWALSFSKHASFYVVTSNAVESLNAALVDARRKGPLALLDFIYSWTFKAFAERRAEITSSMQFPKRVLETVDDAAQAAKGLRCVVNGLHAQVLVDGKTFAVCLDPAFRSCSCGVYATIGLPCSHILRVLTACKQTWVGWVSQYWTMDVYRALYQIPLPAIPTNALVVNNKLTAQLYTPTGSRRKKRFRSAGESETPPRQQRTARTLTCNPIGIESNRARHAAAIAAAPGGILPLGNDAALVTGNHSYTVDLRTNTCTCEGFMMRGACSHLSAAHLAQQEIASKQRPEIISPSLLAPQPPQ